ncbi:alpha/beta fold hydrolase [Aquimarina sp. 2201CG14-23]|uniref:alpha/beta fold hydrolase n=1 Tax=Aquimarina mycalae TaxID=3040073 RepID=UPI0024781B25|nr:alpha/beta hydrolase [Aquimarina sp. 2201CG14-23]MDH7447174.1 alpha/beta hydrolase [Aquimarina sp. 2201CG14-23]
MKNNIVLLHGALGSETQFEKLVTILEKEFNVYTFNFDGHGGIPIKNDFSIDLFTKNTKTFIEQHQLENPIVFGYSMGGYVGINVARKYPDIVHKIITLGTKFDWTPDFSRQEVRMLNPDKIAQKVPKFAQYLKALHSDTYWKEVVLQTAKMMNNLGDTPTLKDEEIEKIQHKALVCLGALDNMVTLEESKRISNTFPNGQFQILENCPHQIERANIPDLAKTIQDFIKN